MLVFLNITRGEILPHDFTHLTPTPIPPPQQQEQQQDNHFLPSVFRETKGEHLPNEILLQRQEEPTHHPNETLKIQKRNKLGRINAVHKGFTFRCGGR